MPVEKGEEEVLVGVGGRSMPLGHGMSDPLEARGVMSLGSLWLCGIPWA